MLLFIIFVLLQYLESIRQFVNENLRHLAHSPAVQMQDVPSDLLPADLRQQDEDSRDPDVRNHQDEADSR